MRSHQIIDLMIANPLKFDEYASVNSEWIGKQFFREIQVNDYSQSSASLISQAIIRTIFTCIIVSLSLILRVGVHTLPGEPLSFEVREGDEFRSRESGSI